MTKLLKNVTFEQYQTSISSADKAGQVTAWQALALMQQGEPRVDATLTSQNKSKIKRVIAAIDKGELIPCRDGGEAAFTYDELYSMDYTNVLKMPFSVLSAGDSLAPAKVKSTDAQTAEKKQTAQVAAFVLQDEEFNTEGLKKSDILSAANNSNHVLHGYAVNLIAEGKAKLSAGKALQSMPTLEADNLPAITKLITGYLVDMQASFPEEFKAIMHSVDAAIENAEQEALANVA